MARPVTLFTIQWGDLPLEEICKLAKQMGYEGLELAKDAHLDVRKAAEDPAYVQEVRDTLAKYDLGCWAISAHLTGQCVTDALQWAYDPRLDGFAPSHLAGKPEEIQKWAVEEMKITAHAAKAMGVDVVTFFMGSPIWKFWYSFPQTTEEMVERGYERIKELWTPIFDEFDRFGIKYALEVHSTEIAYDIWTAKKLLEVLDNRETFGFNFDPSHLLWQGIKPHIFIRNFPDKIYHCHMKDVYVSDDDTASIIGSHLVFGDPRRKWNFRSIGRGMVNFEEIIRELNFIGYEGPYSIEWEDSGMERVQGATESCRYIKDLQIKPSDVAFDAALKN